MLDGIWWLSSEDAFDTASLLTQVHVLGPACTVEPSARAAGAWYGVAGCPSRSIRSAAPTGTAAERCRRCGGATRPGQWRNKVGLNFIELERLFEIPGCCTNQVECPLVPHCSLLSRDLKPAFSCSGWAATGQLSAPAARPHDKCCRSA